MAAKPQDPDPQQDAKFSVVVPQTLEQQLKSIAAARRQSLSAFARTLLEEAAAELDPKAAVEPGTLTVRLRGQLAAGVARVAALLHVPADAVVTGLLARHLPAALDEAKSVAGRLDESMRADAEPRKPRPK